MKPLIVVKLGTSVVTKDDGRLDETVLNGIVEQIARLHETHRVVLVSSGAVAAGQTALKRYSGKLPEQKAAAAIGNPRLIQDYANRFAKHDITVAQTLCERDVFADRKRFLRLREMLETLWQHQVIPIVNENDVVSDLELRFSDNDELATLLAVGFSAGTLLLGTSVDGLMKKGKVVTKIDTFDEQVLGLAEKGTTQFGLGGMLSKLTCADKATAFGVDVVIFNARFPGNVPKALRHETGTWCPAKKSDLSSYHKWVAGVSLVLSRVRVDAGAAKALRQRKSLLSVGVTSIEGSLKQGEIFEIYPARGDDLIGVARSRIDSKSAQGATGKRGLVLAHADEIVIY